MLHYSVCLIIRTHFLVDLFYHVRSMEYVAIEFPVTRVCSPLLWPQDTAEHTQPTIYYVASGHGNRLITIRNNPGQFKTIHKGIMAGQVLNSASKCMKNSSRCQMVWCPHQAAQSSDNTDGSVWVVRNGGGWDSASMDDDGSDGSATGFALTKHAINSTTIGVRQRSFNSQGVRQDVSISFSAITRV